MSAPWMPLYIERYLADTTHLRALESGAYLHLIMHYWQKGGLPDDNRQLAAIAKMTDREWKVARKTLQAFFHDGWKHGRIDKELAKTAELSAKRKNAATQGWSKRANKSDAIADASGMQLHTHAGVARQLQHTSPSGIPPSVPNGTSGAPKSDLLGDRPPDEAEDAKLYRLGKEVLGKNTGGVVKKLLAAKGGSISQAMAALKSAAERADAMAYVQRCIRPAPATPNEADPFGYGGDSDDADLQARLMGDRG